MRMMLKGHTPSPSHTRTGLAHRGEFLIVTMIRACFALMHIGHGDENNE